MTHHHSREDELPSLISQKDKDSIAACVTREQYLSPAVAHGLVLPLDVLRENVVKIIRGMDEKLELFEIGLMSPQDLFRGMMIIEGAQGSGKTVLAEAYAGSIAGATYGRIQATGDMLPSQITGFNQYDRKSGEWIFRESNLYRNFVNVDDATRTPGKVNAAMLQPIAEGEMTVDTVTRQMPDPFWVVFTQNPVEQHGTHPQVEALKDRAMFLFGLGHPDLQALEEILRARRWKDPLKTLEPVVDIGDFRLIQNAVRTVYAHPLLENWISRLVKATILLEQPTFVEVRLEDDLDELTLKEFVAMAVRQGNLDVSEMQALEEISREALELAPKEISAAKRNVIRFLTRSNRKHRDDKLLKENIHVLLSAASVRAEIALQNGARARALRRGRCFVLPEDIETLFISVFNHRVKTEDTLEKRIAHFSGNKTKVYKEFQELCFFLAPPPTKLDWSKE